MELQQRKLFRRFARLPNHAGLQYPVKNAHILDILQY